MMKRYEVDWYKECYPLPDECGKKLFDTHKAALSFCREMNEAGYQIMLIGKTYDPDKED